MWNGINFNCFRNYRLVLIGLLFIIPGCEKVFDLNQPATDAKSVFNEAWKVIDQRYALFEVKGVDWEAKYREYETKLSDQMTEQALFKVIDDMLQTLHDGHVSL